MDSIEKEAAAMAALTFIARLASELERRGVLPDGWSAEELRQAAQDADRDVQFAANPELQRALAAALRSIAGTLRQG